MESETLGPRALDDFCADLISRNNSTWPPTERMLVDAFFSHFEGARTGIFDTLVAWCSSVGIEVLLVRLPDELRGYNYWYERKRAIFITDCDDAILFREHTVFHELRELLEHVFQDIGHPTIAPNQLETHAEEFAVLARMAVVLEGSKSLMECVDHLKSTWAQVGASLLIGAGTFFAALACIVLPRMEHQRSPEPPSANVTLR